MVQEVPQESDRQARIAALMAQAEAAHLQVETILMKRQHDPSWANWQAGFVLDRSLQKLLPRPISEGELARLLVQWDQQYAAMTDAPISRAEYFAQCLLRGGQ